jgi:hypothetical protein
MSKSFLQAGSLHPSEITHIGTRSQLFSSENSENIDQFTLELMDGKKYKFSKLIVDKYPKLLHPDAAYTLHFEAILPLLLGYPPSCIPETMLDDRSEKELFLSNCEFFNITLTDDVILHLSSECVKKVSECVDFVKKEAGKKGEEKLRFCLRKDVAKFCSETEKAFKDIYSDIKPIEIVQKLELGEVKDLVLHDWRSKNAVIPFINKFIKFFLPEGGKKKTKNTKA